MERHSSRDHRGSTEPRNCRTEAALLQEHTADEPQQAANEKQQVP